MSPLNRAAAKSLDVLAAVVVFSLAVCGLAALRWHDAVAGISAAGFSGLLTLLTGAAVGCVAGVLLRHGARLAVVRYILGDLPPADALPPLTVRAGGFGVADIVAIALAGPAASMVGLVAAEALASPLVHSANVVRFAFACFEGVCLLGLLELVPFRLQSSGEDPGRPSAGRAVLDALVAGRARR